MTEAALRLQPRWIGAWILSCAAVPVLQVLGWTAAFKPVLATDPLAGVLGIALWLLIAGAFLAMLLLPVWVLARIAPRLRWWAMALALLAAPAVVLLTANGMRAVQLAFLPGLQHLRGDFEWAVLAALPWPRLLLQAAAVAALAFCIPAFLFARATAVRWFVPLAAVMAAGAAAAVAEQAWQLAGDWWQHFNAMALSGWSREARLEALFLLAGRGALWGATSAAVFLGLAARQLPAPWARSRAPATLAALLVLPPGAAFLCEPNRAQSTWNTVRSALSSAPAEEFSEGEPRIRLAVAAAPRLPEVPSQASFSPDAATIVTIDKQRQVVLASTADGAQLGQLGERLALYESAAWGWSADGHWLALRTWGQEQKVGSYPQHQVRVRLYAVPGYRLVADYRHQGAPCFEPRDRQPLFEPGGRAVWVGCAAATQPAPADLLALRLAVPSLRLAEERRYGELAPLPMGRMAIVRGAVWSWHQGYGRAAEMRLQDLSHDREALRLAPDPATGHGDTMTLQEAILGDDTLSFRYAAGPQRRMQTFVHDSHSGAFLRVVDHGAPGPGSAYQSTHTTPQGWRIESRWQPQSRAGELSVIDAQGRRRQHVRSVAQSVLSVSPDGRWFATRAVGSGQLRVYRIEP